MNIKDTISQVKSALAKAELAGAGIVHTTVATVSANPKGSVIFGGACFLLGVIVKAML